MSYRFILVVVAMAMVLAGCNNSSAEKPARTTPQRVAEVKAQMGKGPDSRTHKVDGDEVKVLDVPVSGAGGLMVKKQQCFVWRDAEYRTASLSCPNPPELALDRDGPDHGMADTTN